MRALRWGLLICCCAIGPAFADVETVVVTAAPPDPVGNDAFSVVRVDAQALHAAPELDRALEQVPGLSSFRRDSCLSANPTTQGVSLRSIAPSGASRALVTLDGVPQNDPFGGWVLWCTLAPEDIESAEVVRGAGAGPYGASALTGVIALDEAGGSGLYAADASGGSMGVKRLAAAGGGDAGPLQIFASGVLESTDGWNPVPPGQRGAGDDNDTVDARTASLRIGAEPFDGIEITARGSVYDIGQHAGLVGAESEATGGTASLTIAKPETPGTLGWRLQTWVRDTDFENDSVAVAANQASTTPADDEYATPTVGWGTNGELRGTVFTATDWTVGFDARETAGETREHYNYSAGAFLDNRVAGGQTFVGGLYTEVASRFDGWLLTAGLRADDWASTGGHLVQGVISSGAVTLDRDFPSRKGTLPTARVGARHDFGDMYIRMAGYEGFRPPTLNELYRPFRMGNNFTLANAALSPEKLYGGEIGVGGNILGVDWDATGFWNKLQNAVTNVTIGHGPGTFPAPAGFIPAGGTVIERENAGDINAYGLEADTHYRPLDWLELNGAFDLVDAHVFGGVAAPQLDGKRPSEAPRWTVTGSVDARPIDRLTLYADVHFESTRFVDDQNTLVLPSATSADVKASWMFAPSWSIYVASDNVFNTRIATTESAAFVYNDDYPRIIRAGIDFQR
jgi:outer membrane cobalamin receptor